MTLFDKRDLEYFSKRTSDSRELAAAATDPAVKAIHLELAEEYGRRAAGENPKNIYRARVAVEMMNRGAKE